MQKYLYFFFFTLLMYGATAQDVTGSWVLVAEEEIHQFSIDRTKNTIEMQLYDENFDLKGKKISLDIVEVVEKNKQIIYIGEIPDDDEYLAFCFFEAQEKDPESIKLYIAKDFNSIEDAKSFEKLSNLGLFLYRKNKFEKIQSFNSLAKIQKFELKKVLEKLLNTLKTEMTKHKDLGEEVELYIISEFYHYFTLERYNPYNKNLGDIIPHFDEDEELLALFEEITILIEKAEN